jgi:multidrug efflux system membrane fusion protein
VISASQRVNIHNVTTGQSRNGTVIVTKGVNAGEDVVLAGQYRLSEGVAVDVVPFARQNEVQNASTASAGMLP